MNSTGDKRLHFIDALRCLSVTMVLGSHVVAASFLGHEASTPAVRTATTFVYMLFRPCAVLYVLISGALLLPADKLDSGFAFLKRRVPRLFIPVIAWSVLYAAWNTLIGRTPALSWDLPARILREPVSQHLWFMYMYLGITIAAPVLHRFTKSASLSDVRYAIFVFLLASVGQVILNTGLGLSLSNYFFAPFGYWAYFLLGAYLLNNDFPPANPKRKALLFASLYLISVAGTTWVMRANPHATTNLFNNPLGPFQLVQSCLLFKLMQTVNFDVLYIQRPRLHAAVQSLTRHSFGVYLGHILMMEFLAWGIFGFQLRWVTWHPFFGIPATWMAMLALSWGFARAVSRIPLLNKALV